ncbi:hypothetical protein PISMIDRAFT_24984 [Pisolithus microcarpus 441]|uniref:Uncharacterized protein n=1 Tax=Pisolithus microcarpus 441 TaxID=765257 RepID=A0A0C9YSS4_9AGAM|nr:hypothetical protein PISMIDRAFT_24984 [Pisolithus microcarpus 441]
MCMDSVSKPDELVGANEKQQLMEEEQNKKEWETITLSPLQPTSGSIVLTTVQDTDILPTPPTPPTPPKAVLLPSESSGMETQQLAHDAFLADPFQEMIDKGEGDAFRHFDFL